MIFRYEGRQAAMKIVETSTQMADPCPDPKPTPVDWGFLNTLALHCCRRLRPKIIPAICG